MDTFILDNKPIFSTLFELTVVSFFLIRFGSSIGKHIRFLFPYLVI